MGFDSSLNLTDKQVASRELLTSYDWNEAPLKLSKYASSYGINLNNQQAQLVVDHLKLVLQKNMQMNLTAIRNPSDSLILNSLDSLLFTSVLNCYSTSPKQEERVLDLGTGAGFPGIPIACSTEFPVSLLDSVGKKIEACHGFIERLGLDDQVAAFHDRFETFAQDYAEANSFQFVVARAVAPLGVLIEYATPFLIPSGYLVLSKGNPTADELEYAVIASKVCGLIFVSRETFELPESKGHREFYVYKKVSRSRIELPRKNGLAKNSPLRLH